MRKIITFGTFDLFHVGHLRILERARLLGDHLTVGVSTDALNLSKKSVYPVFNERERSETSSSIFMTIDNWQHDFPNYSFHLINLLYSLEDKR